MTGTGFAPLTADHPKGVCPAFADALSLELEKILGTAAFSRSPILSRLLRYLVEQTLSGQSDQLKGYTVAVDGLARPDSYDAQLDSYPRVQMVRLRKALETHYTDHAPRGQHSLFLCCGSYRVRMAPPSEAYPQLREHPAGIKEATWQPDAVAVPVAPFPRAGLVPSWSVVAAALLVGLSTWLAATIWFSPPTPSAGTVARARMPTLVVEAKPGATDAATRAAASLLVDGLRRSWVARVRDHGSEAAGEPAARPEYRMTIEADVDHVHAQLTDLRSTTVIWSGSSPLSAAHGSLAPLVARIAGPYGAIARAETARLATGDYGSYACILSYFEHLKTRNAVEKARLQRCLTEPGNDAQLAASLDAVRSLVVLALPNASDRTAQIAVASQFARRAVERDGSDAYAQFAAARTAYAQTSCAAGNRHADRAALANPNDILILAALAALAEQCGNPQASAYLDQAYFIRSESDVALHGVLVLASIALDQSNRLAELGDAIRPPPGPQLPPYLLVEALIAAADGRRSEAASYWSQFRALYPNAGEHDDARLRAVVTADPIRRRILSVLSSRGVIPAQAASRQNRSVGPRQPRPAATAQGRI